MKLAHVPIHLKRELFFDISIKPLDLQRVKKWIRSREDRPALSSTIPEQRRPSCLFNGFDLSVYRTHGRLNKVSSETERLHLRWEVHIDPECLKGTERLSQYTAKCCTNVFYMAESASGGGKMKQMLCSWALFPREKVLFLGILKILQWPHFYGQDGLISPGEKLPVRLWAKRE